MSRGQKLIKGSALNVVLLFLNVAVSFYMMPFLIASLGDRMYGLWSLVCSFIGYYGFLDFGLTSAVSRYVSKAIGAKNEEERNEVIGTAFFLFCGVGLIALCATAILFFVAPLIVKTADDLALLRLLVLIIGVNASIAFPVRVYGAVLRSYLRFDIESCISITKLVLRTAVLIYFLKKGYGLIAVAIITVLFSFLDYAVTVFVVSKKYISLRSFLFRKKNIKKLVTFSSVTFIAQMADVLKFHLDQLVITSFLGLALVTPYQVAIRLYQYGSQLSQQVMGGLGPVFSQDVGSGDREGLQRRFKITTKISIFLAVFICASLAMFGDCFFQRWLDKQYADIYVVLLVLSISGVFALGQRPSVNVFYSHAQHKYYAVMNLVEGLMNLVISVILVQRIGIVGVALGTAIPSVLIKVSAQPYYVCKILRISFNAYMSMFYGTIAKLLLVCGIYYFLVVRVFLRPTYPSLFLLGTGFFAFFSLGFFIVFNKQEKAKLLGSLFGQVGEVKKCQK